MNELENPNPLFQTCWVRRSSSANGSNLISITHHLLLESFSDPSPGTVNLSYNSTTRFIPIRATASVVQRALPVAHEDVAQPLHVVVDGEVVLQLPLVGEAELAAGALTDSPDDGRLEGHVPHLPVR